MGLSLKVLSLNIHKGFSALNVRYVLPQIREKIRENGADIVFLQEALGHHRILGRHHEPTTTQYEYLADGVWNDFAYGKNAVTDSSHHGNAILSRFPIVEWKNVDISTNALEHRGLLMCRVHDPKNRKEVICACTHLDLFARGRKQQFRRIQEELTAFAPAGVPIVLAGDFNDWTTQAGTELAKPLDLVEAFEKTTGSLARTFPALWPRLRLDRIYVRGLEIKKTACLTDAVWRKLSDHLAITAELCGRRETSLSTEPLPSTKPTVDLAKASTRLEIFRTGDEYFPRLLQALREAQNDILFEVYIFRDDDTGKAVASELQAAAQRGVRVRLLLDAWGSNELSDAFIGKLQSAGVEIVFYRPVGKHFWRFKKHLMRRLHRKIVVVDNRIAFVGGINVQDEQVTTKKNKALFDYAVAAHGELVNEIRENSESLWSSAHARRSFLTLPHRQPKRAPTQAPAGSDAWFISRDNHANRAAIEDEYLRLIDASRSEIIIASAYFLPYRNLQLALMRAAHRGVKVKLLLQGLVDIFLIRYATKGLYEDLLRGGLEVYEDDDSVVHAKVAVFDREFLTVGSSNLDPLSLGLTLEANVFCRERNLASQLAAQLESEFTNSCTRIVPETLGKATLLERLIWKTSFVVVRAISRIFVVRA